MLEVDEETPFGPIVDVAWLRNHRETPGVRIIDTRQFGQYLMGHIAGAVNLDVNMIRLPNSSASAIEGFVSQAQTELSRIGIQPSDRVIFYEDFSGASAARGVWLLDAVGLGGGALLDGGLRAWVQAGEPLSRDMPDATPSALTLSLDSSVLATADQIVAALEANANLDIVDTRNDMEFVSGTIPRAQHLEWLHHLAPDGTLRPLAELQDLYSAMGITADQNRPVVTFCGSGYRAAHTYLVLKALGLTDVRNYAPSWGEWGRRPDLPVDVPRYR